MERFVSRYINFLYTPVDSRIYSLFRMAFSLAVFFNLLNLGDYKASLFSNKGMIDMAFVKKLCAGWPYWSVFHHYNSPEAVEIIFILVSFAIIFCFIGLFTRFSILAVYAWQVSHMYALFPVMSGWDSVLTLCSFILLISPASDVWSVDGWIKKKLFKKELALTAPAYGLYMLRYQLCLIYLSTAALKLYNHWWVSGELYGYFMFSAYSRFQYIFFAENLWLSKILTYGTLVIEFTVPLLLIIRKTRWLGFVFGISLHLGIMFTSNLFVFSFAMVILYIPWLDNLNVTGSLLKRRNSFVLSSA